MALLKNSEHKKSIQLLHAELWERLEEQDEWHAQAFLEQSIQQCRNDNHIQSVWDAAMDFVRTPWFWVSVLTGSLAVCLACFAFLWAALKVE
ncbi:hypothetical protein GC093_02460 [Paenibacillus sp. LMG 31456]|uniref:Uncharacterized protein n=1 Tax=Paenibacillus foliorum TaxID=2654974 RepID=A0A972GKN9_9BACL|nr:hypothetical protein [Paenibacillus foliorum]NOU92098.1 hypothetical protein [Paenibacillus foliorum]